MCSSDVDSSHINAHSTFDFTSPLGLEFGEFMLDGDFWAVANQHGLLQTEGLPSKSTG
jgi:hypothetical protein